MEGPLHPIQCSHLLSLEPDNRVVQQVGEIQLPPLLYDIPVLTHKQPANVGEEEATAGIVRVRICLRVLVVHTVVSAPLVDVILHRKHGGVRGERPSSAPAVPPPAPSPHSNSNKPLSDAPQKRLSTKDILRDPSFAAGQPITLLLSVPMQNGTWSGNWTQTRHIPGLETAGSQQPLGSYNHQPALVLCPPWVFAVQGWTLGWRNEVDTCLHYYYLCYYYPCHRGAGIFN